MSDIPGAIADDFYAKGSGSIFELLDILGNIDIEKVKQSRCTSAPIWIPSPAIDWDIPSTAAVGCPECLRVFFNPSIAGQSSSQKANALTVIIPCSSPSLHNWRAT